MPALSEGVKHVGKGSRREATQRLMQIAEAQQGFFTAFQAREAGFGRQAQSYNVKMGNWLRVHRGIFRLAFYPSTDRPDLMLWYLWAHDRNGQPEGVYSHETAIGIHGLSDLMPSNLHMTVPPTFHRTVVPKNLVLHRGQLDAEDIEYLHDVAVTRPIRTNVDMVESQTVSPDILQQALRQALKSGLITKTDLLRLNGDSKAKLYTLLIEVLV